MTEMTDRRGAARHSALNGMERQAPAGLHRLIYTSRVMPVRPSSHARPVDVTSIATGAQSRNAALGLTGCLVCVQDHFIQVLEGEPGDLEAVFEAICVDFRHHQLNLVDYSPSRRRTFADWDMVPIDAETTEEPEKLEDLLLSIRAGMNPAAIVNVLSELVAAEPALRPEPEVSSARG